MSRRLRDQIQIAVICGQAWICGGMYGMATERGMKHWWDWMTFALGVAGGLFFMAAAAFLSGEVEPESEPSVDDRQPQHEEDKPK